jgi:hypothetical protein
MNEHGASKQKSSFFCTQPPLAPEDVAGIQDDRSISFRVSLLKKSTGEGVSKKTFFRVQRQ